MSMQYFTLAAFVLITSFSGLLGCSKPAPEKPSQDQTDGETTATANVAPQKDNQLPPADATAAQVCQRFMMLLQQGERTLAEELLTRQALATTGKLDLELEAMGGSNAKVSVGEAMYATDRAKLAQVPCTIRETGSSDQEITWLMRRLNSGWRISGLIVSSPRGPELLSLENHRDVATIKGQTEPVDANDFPETSQIQLTSAEEEIDQ